MDERKLSCRSEAPGPQAVCDCFECRSAKPIEGYLQRSYARLYNADPECEHVIIGGHNWSGVK